MANREEMLKKFAELKSKGVKIALGDIITEDEKKNFSSIKNIPLSDKPQKDLPLKYAKKETTKFLKKMMKSPRINEIEILDELSFSFCFNDSTYRIGYDLQSECMVINEGREFDENSIHEIGYYELEENYF